MALVLRLRRFLPFTNPASLLHHHRHQSTSNSSSSLREVRNAVKKLSVMEHPWKTPFRDKFSPGPGPSFSSNLTSYIYSFPPPPSFDSKEEAEPASDSRNLDEKLEQLKLKALSFKHRRDTDQERLSDLMESKRYFFEENLLNISEFVMMEERKNMGLPQTQTREEIRIDIDFLITRVMRNNEKTVEVIQLAQVLTNSRLTLLYYEIVENLHEMKKDLRQEVWDGFNEDLMAAIEVEVKEFELLAEETDLNLTFFKQWITNLLEIGRNW